MDLSFDLPIIWSIVAAIGVLVYVLLDGFDLGVGVLFNFVGDEGEKRAMMNTIAPVWDGNETWLILGGAGLLSGFPMVYSVLLPAFYVPLAIMLMAMIFRGVGFEFRHVAGRSKPFWDRGFGIGSTIAAFVQGAAIGAWVQGIHVVDGAFAGGPFDWLSPFAILCGIGLVFGYALLGATWLIWRTRGLQQAWAFRQAPKLLLATLLAIAAISAWTPFHDPQVVDRWFTLPDAFLWWPIPALIAITALALWRAVDKRQSLAPFLLSGLLFIWTFLGMVVSIWPTAIPYHVTIWDAAAPDNSLVFMLYGVAILVPVILIYTGYVYWVFRGKASPEGGYE